MFVFSMDLFKLKVQANALRLDVPNLHNNIFSVLVLDIALPGALSNTFTSYGT